MKIENLFDFLVPIAILVLYFMLNARKKKEEPTDPQQEPREKPAQSFRSDSTPASLRPEPITPSVNLRQAPFQSNIEERKFISVIEDGRYSSAINEGGLSGFASGELDKKSDANGAYSHIHKKKISRAKNLFNKKSLRQAFILNEILNRPHQ